MAGSSIAFANSFAALAASWPVAVAKSADSNAIFCSASPPRVRTCTRSAMMAEAMLLLIPGSSIISFLSCLMASEFRKPARPVASNCAISVMLVRSVLSEYAMAAPKPTTAAATTV
nr:hypothetical protein [Delftia sp.]